MSHDMPSKENSSTVTTLSKPEEYHGGLCAEWDHTVSLRHMWFYPFIASPVGITAGETTCKHKYSVLGVFGWQKLKMHKLQGVIKHLRFPAQSHSADGRERRATCMSDTYFKCLSDVRHAASNAPLRCLVLAPLWHEVGPNEKWQAVLRFGRF